MNNKLKRFVNWRTVTALLLMALCIMMLCMGCKTKMEWYKMEGMVFGTTYHIAYQYKMAEDSVIKKQLERVDNSLSLFNGQSTLSRLNRGETVEIDSLFITVFNKGMDVSKATGGSFDMTVAPLVNLWGFGKDGKCGQNFDSLKVIADSLMTKVGYEKCQLLIKGDSMRLINGTVDAAAIAKGFACDVVATALKSNGCENFCVEIGGEVVVSGHNSRESEWRIGINKPDEENGNDVEDALNLTDCGMATSGNYRNFYQMGDVKVSHTIDPRSGIPVASDILSATIVADDCITADAWATACMVAGLKQAVGWMFEHKELKAYFITMKGKELKMTVVENGELKNW